MSEMRMSLGIGMVIVVLGVPTIGCIDKQYAEESDGTGFADGTDEGLDGPAEGPAESSSEAPGEGDSAGEGESEESGVVLDVIRPGESFGEDEGPIDEGESSGDDGPGPDFGSSCVPFIDPRRSLLETNPEALDGFTMPAILTRAALSSDLVGDPEFTYTRLVDSFSTVEGAALPGGSHCDDALVDGVPSLGGYPLQCPRAEAAQVDQIDEWFAIAAVNRFDLASADGSDCGEQRVILASPSLGRSFVIFEARIPNPEPSCGLAACRPVVDFWLGLGELDDPVARNHELRLAFLDGHPTLTEAGFEPFMAGVNLTFGSGQVRSNSLIDNPWTLREFRYVAEGTRLGVVAVPVTNNSFGPLWNDLADELEGPGCRQSILDNLEGLLVDDVAAMGLVVAPSCHAGESREDENVDYAAALVSGSGAFEVELADRLAELGSDLDPIDVANRATFASNCMGCHADSIGVDLGHGVIAPASLGFVHVDDLAMEPCDDGQCFAISKALHDRFLPARLAVLDGFLAEFGCEGLCSDPGPGALGLLLDGPATTGIPDRSEGVSRLRARELELLAGLTKRTLGGRPRGAH